MITSFFIHLNLVFLFIGGNISWRGFGLDSLFVPIWRWWNYEGCQSRCWSKRKSLWKYVNKKKENSFNLQFLLGIYAPLENMKLTMLLTEDLGPGWLLKILEIVQAKFEFRSGVRAHGKEWILKRCKSKFE